MLRLPPFEYHQPETVDQALSLLDAYGPDAMLVAGGTDVIPNMKHRLHEPGHLVSLRRIAALEGIAEQDGEVVMGAAETLSALSRHPLVVDRLPALADAAAHVAGPQLRNVGTLGGNLCLDTRCTYYNQSYFWRRSLGFCLKKDGDTCHVTQVGKKCVAAHSADTPPVLWVLDARVDLVSSRGQRTVPVDEFFVADGIRNTVREPDELVTRVRAPLPPQRTGMAYEKVRPRRSIDFPALNLAVRVTLGDGERIEEIRLVVSGLGSRPREVGLEDVIGDRLDDDAVARIANTAHRQCRPLTNHIVDPEWRRAMVPVYTRRALDRIMAAIRAPTSP